MALIFILHVLIFLTELKSGLGLECLNPKGNFIDWYSVYKAPKIRNKPDVFTQGLAHYYLDVASPSWTLSKFSINDTGTAVYNTLQQVYKSQDQDMLYIMYNDEDPKGHTSIARGHTKGVLAFDGKKGFWLIHSVPKFPPNRAAGYSYAHNGETFGQSFLCISLPYEMLKVVGTQLFHNQPHVYDYHIPKQAQTDFPVLMEVVHQKDPQSGPWYSVMTLKSTKGQEFTSFAKSVNFDRELYVDLVAPTLKDSLLVETWMDGGGQIATNCSSQYKVYNAVTIALPDDVTFKRSRDHSKWATGFSGTTPSKHTDGYWTCIGDINRMYTQFKRGGGTVCLNHQALWKTFHQSVDKFERCGRN